jgi:hypothetical protein
MSHADRDDEARAIMEIVQRAPQMASHTADVVAPLLAAIKARIDNRHEEDPECFECGGTSEDVESSGEPHKKHCPLHSRNFGQPPEVLRRYSDD